MKKLLLLIALCITVSCAGRHIKYGEMNEHAVQSMHPGNIEDAGENDADSGQ